MKLFNERFLVVPGIEPGAADSESAMLTSQPQNVRNCWKNEEFQKITWIEIFEVNFKAILDNEYAK